MAQWALRRLTMAAALLVAAGAAPAAESIGAGDQIRVTVFQNPDLTTETRVAGDGTISFPLLGEVVLAGLSPAAAGERIAAQLKQRDFLRNPQVNIAVMQVRSRQVSVLGQVARPGRYALDEANPRLSDVLALAGGIAPTGDDTVTVVRERDGRAEHLQIDVAGMYRSGDLSRNLEMRDGDSVYVQRAPVFYIYGEVQRAGAYRLEPGMLVMRALSVGGGLTPRGTERGPRIHRRLPDGTEQRIDARLGDLVQPDDVIYIRESLF